MKSYKIKLKIKSLEYGNFHLFVQGKLNGKSLNICVDTGASRTCIDREFFLQNVSTELNNSESAINATLGTTNLEVYESVIENFSIGRFKQPHFNVAIVDMDAVNQAYKMVNLPPIQMILGSDFFVSHNAVIDCLNKSLILNIV